MHRGRGLPSLNPWTEHIDFVPFNVLYVNGEPVDDWTGGDLERLEAALAALEA